MAITEIGEVLIGTRKKDYLFRPSFAAMVKIGNPKEIVRVFHSINDSESLIRRAVAAYGKVPSWLIAYIESTQFSSKRVGAAIDILTACCEDDCSVLTGEMVPSRKRDDVLLWRSGLLPLSDIIVLASRLISHGIIGRAKVRQLQRNEPRGIVTEFKAIEYINSARIHFGMPYAEAERLTLTEFILLLNAKFPQEKGFTRDEYDAVMDEDDRKWQEMIDKQGR